MHRSLLPPAQWAELEFGSAELGDRRRTERLITMGTNLAEHPGGTLPQAFPEWDELKAAYRLLDKPHMGYEAIQGPHWQRTRGACREPGEYLLIEDTMDLDYTGHPAAPELGFIGDGRGRGFRVHSNLVGRVEEWTAAGRPQVSLRGLLGQQCGCPRKPPKAETRGQRLRRSRQSQRWSAVLEELGPPPAGCQWVYVADCESDFYEPMERCLRLGTGFVIRAYQDRALADGSAHLPEVIAQAPVRGTMDLELRARPGQSARTARVEVRVARMTLQGPWRPGGWKADFTVNVVEIKEAAAPPGAEPLHWILLTSLDCNPWEEVQRVVGRYTARWLIEEYHKAVQSGTRVEESQLEQQHRLEALIAILAIVALRLVGTKLLARARPNEVVTPEEFGPEALAILSAKYGEPKGGWTHLNLIIAIARMGGFLARKHDGMPGWQTIWRGWGRLMQMCQGLEIIKRHAERCG